MRSVFSFPAAALCAALGTTAAQAQDNLLWEGAYLGFSTNIVSPEIGDPAGYDLPLQEGTAFAGFGGYLFAFGDNYVAGAELGYQLETTFNVDTGDDATMDSTVLARARFGYAVGNVLLYGTLGYMSTEFTYATDAINGEAASGIVYGIGLQAMMLDNVSFRIDYTSTHLDPDNNIFPNADSQIDANAVSLGLAYHF